MKNGRNPRRAYNKDGTMIPPATVANTRALGCEYARVFCENDECRHDGLVRLDLFPDDFPAPDIALKVRCSQCGGKRLTVHVNVEEIYRRWEARHQGKG